jgi:hypothetical protein
MTTMDILYVDSTGHAVGALSCTVQADLPSLAGVASLEVPLRPYSSDLSVLTPLFLTFRAGELRIARLEAQFTDPLDVFDWCVMTRTTPDQRVEYRLEQLVGVKIDAPRRKGKPSIVDVPRLGMATELVLEVRTQEERKLRQTVLFDSPTGPKQISLEVPESEFVLLLEGHKPIVVPPIAP